MLVHEYFTDGELSCRCGCGKIADYRAAERLYVVRVLLGAPLIITSAARCLTHNIAVGGKPSSKHILGRAFDIHFSANRQNERPLFVELCKMAGFTGFGFADTFIHIDDAHKKITDWDY